MNQVCRSCLRSKQKREPSVFPGFSFEVSGRLDSFKRLTLCSHSTSFSYKKIICSLSVKRLSKYFDGNYRHVIFFYNRMCSTRYRLQTDLKADAKASPRFQPGWQCFIFCLLHSSKTYSLRNQKVQLKF